jgi:hypothetical protein
MDLINSNVEQGVATNIANLRNRPISYGSSIVSRETVRYYATGASAYNSRNNRQITIKLSSTNYIDPSTATLNFQLRTGADSGLVPECTLPLLFQSVSLRVGGRVVEDIQNAAEILRPLFYASNAASVVNGPIGSAAGCYKFKKTTGAYLANADSYGTASGIANSSTTAYLGFDNNTGTSAPPGLTVKVPNNSSLLRNSSGATVLPEMAAWLRCGGTADNNRLVNGQTLTGRYYSVRLADIFGLFRSAEAFLPLRNMQQIQLDFVLPDVNKMFVNPLTYANTSNNIASTVAGTNTDLVDFSIVSPYVCVDVIQPSEGTTAMIDEMCASSSGLALLYDSYSTQKQSVNYSTSINVQSSKSYSHVRDTYAFFQPVAVSNGSPCLNGSQYYYGSRVADWRVSIGSAQFPLISCDSVSQSLFELQKSFAMHSSNEGGSVIDLATYTGATQFFGDVCRPFFPNLTLGQTYNTSADNKAASALQASCLFAEPNSVYILGCSHEKSITKGGRSLSGVNTRLTSSMINLNLSMRNVLDTDASNVNSAVALNTVDAILGTGPLAITIAAHYEALLIIANNSIVVAD